MEELLFTKLQALAQASQEVPVNYRRFLSYPDTLWLIESGEGAVFAMEKTGNLVENGVIDKGPLSYLSSVAPGSLLFGFNLTDKDPVAFLVITHSSMKWKKIKISAIQELLKQEPALAAPMAVCMNAWVHQFGHDIESFSIENEEHLLEPSKTMDLVAADVIRPFRSVDPKHKEDVIWVEVLEGDAYFLGFNAFKITKETGIFPLSPLSWISSKDKLSVRGLSTEEALLHPNFWKGFEAFQTIALKLTQLHIERQRAADIKKMQTIEKLDEIAIDGSLKHIAATMQGKPVPRLSNEQDPLLRACQIIGHEMDLNFIPLKEKYSQASYHQALMELSEKAGARLRKVVLEDQFWKHDSLHLLAFYKEGHAPVALISLGGKKYELIDPMTMQRIEVNEKVASLLTSEAYTFYQPFPEGKLTGMAILRFIAKGRAREMWTIALMGLLGGLLSLFPPYFNKVLFDDVIGDGEADLLWQVIVGFVIIAVSTGVFLFTRSLTMLRVTGLVDYKVESALWDRILTLPTKFFRQFTVGNLIERVYAVSEIHKLVSGTVVKVLVSGLFSFFYFFAMFYYSSTLALIGLGIIALNVFISGVCIVLKTTLQRQILAISGMLNGLVVQIISGVGKLRISGAENRAFAYWSIHYSDLKRLTKKSQSVQNIVTTMSAFWPVLSLTIMLTIVMASLQSTLASGGAVPLSIGALIAFFAAYLPFSHAIFDVSNTAISVIQVVPLWERAKVILQETPEVSASKSKVDHLTGDLILDHVHFRYDENGPLVLDGVSLYANPGEFIAIIGPTGCGKSTVMRIMLGFEVPESGSIYYNGKDLAGLDLRSIRHQIGSVLQNGTIFSGSLYDNIVCGGIYTKDQVEYALKLSGFDGDLKDLPMGLHTVVQSGGGSFSGGQLQRLLIARALISKPKILIFDEATSALDNKTQELISKNLDELKVTRIVIAHRLTTIRNADRIYVMEAGKVIQTGTFEELAAQDGLFKQMLKRQNL